MRKIVLILILMVCGCAMADAQGVITRKTGTTQTTPSPKKTKKKTASKTQQKSTVTAPRVSSLNQLRNLDLYATRGGQDYFFSVGEWEALSPSQQKKYTRQGVIIKYDGQCFALALNDSGKSMSWDEAMGLYGTSLPTKEQAEAMADQYQAVNAAIIAFGGDENPAGYYWTRTEYGSSIAWIVGMNYGYVSNNHLKSYSSRVRAVAPVVESGEAVSAI